MGLTEEELALADKERKLQLEKLRLGDNKIVTILPPQQSAGLDRQYTHLTEEETMKFMKEEQMEKQKRHSNQRIWSKTFPSFDYFNIRDELVRIPVDKLHCLESIINIRRRLDSMTDLKHILDNENNFTFAMELVNNYIMMHINLMKLQISSKLEGDSEKSQYFKSNSELQKFLEICEGTKFLGHFEKFRSDILEICQDELKKEKESRQNATVEMKIAVVAHFVRVENLVRKFGKTRENWLEMKKKNGNLYRILPEERDFYSENALKNYGNVIGEMKVLAEEGGQFNKEFVEYFLKKMAFSSFSTLCAQSVQYFGDGHPKFTIGLPYDRLEELINWSFLTFATIQNNPTAMNFEIFNHGIKYFHNNWN